jgi:hypothetical protein
VHRWKVAGWQLSPITKEVFFGFVGFVTKKK